MHRPPERAKQNVQASRPERSNEHRTGQSRQAHCTPLEVFTHAMRGFGIEGSASGKGWRFDCTRQHRSRKTVAVAESSDGTLLIHAHCGCETSAILADLGLSLSDLYQKRPTDSTPEGRREARAAMRMASWSAALETLAFEARIVWIAGHDLRRGVLSQSDLDRVGVALDRIDRSRSVLHGH